MDILLMFILFCYGLAVTLSIGKIFEPTREWIKERSEWGYKFIKCPMCLSFWIGAITSIALWNWPHLTSLPHSMAMGSEIGFDLYKHLIRPVYFGFIAAAGSFILHALVWRLALKDKDF